MGTGGYSKGSDRLMSPAIPGDGWKRSDSGETRARTKVSQTIMVKDALFHTKKKNRSKPYKDGRRVEMLSELVATS